MTRDDHCAKWYAEQDAVYAILTFAMIVQLFLDGVVHVLGSARVLEFFVAWIVYHP